MKGIHESIANGPAAAIMFWDFLQKSSPQEVIDFVTSTLSRVESSEETIFHCKLPGICYPVNPNSENCLRLQDEAIIQLLKILHAAFGDRNGLSGFFPAGGFAEALEKTQGESLEFFEDFFWKLPASRTFNYKPNPAFVEVKKWIIKLVVEFADSGERITHDEINFRFLIAAYTGNSVRYVSSEEKKFIEGHLRDGLRDYSPDEIITWLREPELPFELQEILMVACIKKLDVSIARNVILSMCASLSS